MKIGRYEAPLLEAARGGDGHALARLLEIAQPDIRRYARLNCRRAEDAEDAVQETLWLLYRHFGALRSLSALPGWLLTVVRRECIRIGRKFLGNPADHVDPDEELRLAHRPDEDLRLDLARAIQSLPPHYREVVVLRDVEERTIEEMAGKLGQSRESVKARLHRARSLIREYLGGAGF